MATRNVNELTQGVKGETENMRHKFTSLEQNLKELSAGNLFGQIETMIAELKRLNDLNDKHEVRYFLLCTELERKTKMLEDYSLQLASFDEALKRKEHEHRLELTRIRDEEVRLLQKTLETEIENHRNLASQEKSRLERRIQDLQNELARRDADIENLRKQSFGQTDQISKLKQEVQDLQYRMNDQQRLHEADLAKTRAEFSSTLSQMEQRHKLDLEQLRREAEEAKQREAERQRGLMAEHYSQQLGQKDAEINRLASASDQQRTRVFELEREHQSLVQQLDARTREASEYKERLLSLNKSHDEYVLRISETHRTQIQKAIADKEKEWKEKAEGDLLKLEKDLKDKKASILRLEQQMIHLEKENQRNGARLNDMTIERDELKSKYADLEKRLNDDLQMIQESLTIQIEERQGEIERLALQNRDLSEMYSIQLEQERGKAQSVQMENEMLRKEIQKLRDLSEQRNREIEEWRQKYRGYITSEEAASMREELNRLRRINMDSEEDIARLKSEIGKQNERLRSFAAEIETKEHDLANMSELGNRRKQELLNVQQENDKLMTMLRNAVDLRDNTDAQKLIAEEKYVKMDREIQQLRHERDRYKAEFERSQMLLQQANSKLTDNYNQMEQMGSGNQRVSTTTTTMRASNMYSSKVIDPNYRGEAFGGSGR